MEAEDLFPPLTMQFLPQMGCCRLAQLCISSRVGRGREAAAIILQWQMWEQQQEG